MSPSPKVEIRLLSPSLLVPGDHVRGTLVVDILEKPYEMTGIYVELLGREDTFVVVTRTNGNGVVSTEVRRFHLDHVNLHVTVYGFSKSSGKSGGAVLEPGHYEYPFDLQLPYAAPPSYTASVSSGGSAIEYVLRGVVSVPLRRSVEKRLSVTVLPVASWEQVQLALGNGLSCPLMTVPVTHFCGCSTSKTQSVRLSLQLCPSIVVLGGAMAERCNDERQRVAQSSGDLVMASSLDADACAGTSCLDDDALVKAVGEGTGESGPAGKCHCDALPALSATEEGGSELSPSDALPGRLVRVYRNNEDLNYPFQPSNRAPGIVCARVVLENSTKAALKTIVIALCQERVAKAGGCTRSSRVSLSQVSVQFTEQPCAKGERVAVDVELPIRRDLMYTSASRARLRTCATLATPAFFCQTSVEVFIPKVSLKEDVLPFPGCVQIVDMVGAPGVPHTPLPTSFMTTLTLPE